MSIKPGAGCVVNASASSGQIHGGGGDLNGLERIFVV